MRLFWAIFKHCINSKESFIRQKISFLIFTFFLFCRLFVFLRKNQRKEKIACFVDVKMEFLLICCLIRLITKRQNKWEVLEKKLHIIKHDGSSEATVTIVFLSFIPQRKIVLQYFSILMKKL